MVYDSLYCKIYLSSEKQIEELYLMINDILTGELEPIRTIKTEWGELDLRYNSDFDAERLKKNVDDFIFWPYYLDIEPNNGIEQMYIEKIAMLINHLKSKNIKVIASCDFEDEL